MIDSISNILPGFVLLSHVVFILLVGILFTRTDWSKQIASWVGQRAILLAFLVSIGAVLGSLFYSNILGFSPCVLCWWQRVFLFPVPVILGIALYKKDDEVMKYVLPLAVISGLLALYQSYVYLGGESVLPCTAEGGECSRIYVMAFGYITIPLMSLTISLYLILLSRFKKLYA